MAVKIPRAELTADKVHEFRQELEVMARIVHPRIVALLGAYFPKDLKKGQLKIVMELFGDDVEKVLLDPKQRESFSLFERVKWLKQVAEGMAWIHGAGTVHRDLKPSNVLFDAKSRSVKVCDFGLSLLLQPGESSHLDPKGTPLYVAPELVTNGPTTHACDVYSFGIMGYVFVARERPYDNRTDLPEDVAEFLGVVVEGMRPWDQEGKYAFPPEQECPKSLQQLLTACWAGDFQDRPSFEEVLECFDYVLVDCAISSSAAGRKFWKKRFVDAASGVMEEVPWKDFHAAFWADFALPIQNEEEDRVHYKCVRELFAVTTPQGEFVSLERFGRVLGFLPELKRGRQWFQHVTDLCRQPWFWGDTSSRDAYKALVPASSRSFMVRFSGQAPWYTVSFKEKSGQVLHRRIIRKYGDESVKFENADIHPRAAETFSSLPHMIETIQPLMRWKALQGGPTWWIFHEQEVGGKDPRQQYGGYFSQPQPQAAKKGGGGGGGGGAVAAADEEDSSESDDAVTIAQPKKPVQTKITKDMLKPLLKIRFLGRPGVVTEIKGDKLQVLFADNGRKEWVKLQAVIDRGMGEN